MGIIVRHYKDLYLTNQYNGKGLYQQSFPPFRTVDPCNIYFCLHENQKNQQKGTLGALGFCIFCFFMFFPFFHFHLSIFPKSQGKPKRNKKNNPVRRIWSKSIPDCFFCFFGFPRFSRGFLVSQAPTVQKLEENQKKQKKQSCEKNLG